MKRFCQILYVVVWSAVAAHAGEVATFQPQDPGVEDPEYFPLPIVGAVKEFSVSLMSGGNTQKGTAKLTTEREEELKGHKYFKQVVEMSGFQGDSSYATYVWYAADGVHMVEERSKNAPEYVNPQFPLSIGKEWNYLNPSVGTTTHCKAEAVEDVKIGDQVYKDCLKLSETREAAINYQVITEKWYAPKIGLVKIVVRNKLEVSAEYLFIKPAASAK